eukprot:10152575-Ditylum_brightwellii.AAC.1
MELYQQGKDGEAEECFVVELELAAFSERKKFILNFIEKNGKLCQEKRRQCKRCIMIRTMR